MAQSTVHKTGFVFVFVLFLGGEGGMYRRGGGGGGVDLLRKVDQKGEKVEFIKEWQKQTSPK